MERRIFSEAIVTPEGVISGEVVIRDGEIAAVDGKPAAGCLDEDWGGDWLIPGLVDIHTDNLERHYQPRPGALRPAPRRSRGAL